LKDQLHTNPSNYELDYSLDFCLHILKQVDFLFALLVKKLLTLKFSRTIDFDNRNFNDLQEVNFFTIDS